MLKRRIFGKEVSTVWHPNVSVRCFGVNGILGHMDRQMITGAVFIDLKKPFNLVDHECLLFKLGHYRVWILIQFFTQLC